MKNPKRLIAWITTGVLALFAAVYLALMSYAFVSDVNIDLSGLGRPAQLLTAFLVFAAMTPILCLYALWRDERWLYLAGGASTVLPTLFFGWVTFGSVESVGQMSELIFVFVPLVLGCVVGFLQFSLSIEAGKARG